MTTHHFHAVVWIDHHEARVFHFNPADAERLVLHPDHPTRHIHHKANSIGSGHVSADHDYLHAVAESVADAGAVLIAGPANARTELVEHIRVHDPQLTRLIAGAEMSTIQATRNSSLMQRNILWRQTGCGRRNWLRCPDVSVSIGPSAMAAASRPRG